MDIVKDKAALTKPCSNVSLSEGIEIGEKLVELVKSNENEWVGLAANQIGIDARVCAVALQGNFKGTYQYFVNPKIINTSSETFEFLEGCLSFPGKRIPTKRYREITVIADNLSEGSSVVFYADPAKYDLQLEAACIQHEIDHLDGITMFDRQTNKTVINGPKLKRNQKIVITKDGFNSKTIKYKKFDSFKTDGWNIKEVL